MSEASVAAFWRSLAQTTPARIGLGRSGSGLPSSRSLALALAHAKARDAVHAPFDAAAMAARLQELGLDCLDVASAAPSREAYLLRPDLGRRLSPSGVAALQAVTGPAADIAIIIADGLSSTAVHNHAGPLMDALLPLVRAERWTLAPVVVATQARVALGDEIGALLQVRATLMLIGERPGLSSPDSLGLYLTFGPRIGRHDGERNCISNIHGAGLGHAAAAGKAVWLMRQMLVRCLSGVALKDESDLPAVDGRRPVALPGGA